MRRYRQTTIPQWAIFALDCFLFLLAFIFAEALSIGYFALLRIKLDFVIVTCMTVVSFLVVKPYRGIIRYLGINDVVRISMSCVAPMVLLLAMSLINNQLHLFSRAVLISYKMTVLLYMLLFGMMVLSRLIIQRIFNEYVRYSRPLENVVIYGAGSAGVITLHALKQDKEKDFKVVAFIDDDVSKLGQHLDGIPVLGIRTVLSSKYVKAKNIQQLIIAIPTLRSFQRRAITNRALDLGLSVKSVPQLNKWIEGSFTSNQIENIKIEDLLQRDSIVLDPDNVNREVGGKVVLVTGAAGSIGSEICRQLLQHNPKKVLMLDQAESPMYDLQFEFRNEEPYCKSIDRMEFLIANIKDQARMEEIFSQFRPQVVYNAAAYKHVPFMEENAYEAVHVNVFGTKILADLAIKYGTEKFVMVSTDKAVNPTNIMGCTKRMAEIYIQSRQSGKTAFVTTRFGNVLGSNGSVVPLFKKQLAAGGPLTVTHREIVRYFMTIPEACSLVLEAGAMGKGGDIFVFDMGKAVKIYDLAKRMIQLSGMKHVEIKEIGLRPGEKLYEELLATKEGTIPTYHPKIMHAKVRQYTPDEVDREYASLKETLMTLDDMKIVAAMKRIVPEFISNNSIYCQLDEQTK